MKNNTLEIEKLYQLIQTTSFNTEEENFEIEKVLNELDLQESSYLNIREN